MYRIYTHRINPALTLEPPILIVPPPPDMLDIRILIVAAPRPQHKLQQQNLAVTNAAIAELGQRA